MVKASNTKVERKNDTIVENDTQAILSYNSELLSSRKSQLKESQINDDLIMSLSDAYETKRTCQVNEWERLGRLYKQRAA